MHLLVVFTHVFKSRSRVQKFVNNKIKNNKSKKKRQTTKTNTHTNVFSCCCCCCCCGGKITCLVLFSHTSYHPFVFLKGSKEYKGREGEGEEVFWLFYLVDDLMDWSSCWNLLNADWPGWPDREKFDWRVVVTKKSQNQIEWSWWMDGWMDGWMRKNTFSFGLDGRRTECVVATALDHVSRTWKQGKKKNKFEI